jgi:hypothetical protein
MNKTTRTLSIIAYYLSEYDINAVHALGFENRKEALKKVSIALGHDNNYLKFRRDEFDALPESSSHRKGWDRDPSKDVVKMAAHLRRLSFKDLTDIVKGLLATADSTLIDMPNTDNNIDRSVNADVFSEEELESIINFSDSKAKIEMVTKSSAIRIYDTSIIHNLKKLYQGQCQICGSNPLDTLAVDICEAHHIEPFSKTQNNDASNIIIVCPNHHRLLHKVKFVFNPWKVEFVHNSITLSVKLDCHLKG